MTRYERIMKMTIEELAEWLDSGDLHADCCACAYHIRREFLRSFRKETEQENKEAVNDGR